MKAAFLDRDGVINEDRDDYVKNVKELKIYPHVPEAIRCLNEAGYAVVVVSNQQGVAKGVLSENDLQMIEDEIKRHVEAAGGRIAAFYYCKHLASDNCACRKPKPGMLFRAADDLGIDLKQSVMIGDTERDVQAGQSAGCRTVLLLTGKLTKEDLKTLAYKPDDVASDLREAAERLCVTNPQDSSSTF